MTELIAAIDLAELRRLLVEFHHPELPFEATHGRPATRADSLEWYRAHARRLLANALVEQADLIVAALETFAQTRPSDKAVVGHRGRVRCVKIEDSPRVKIGDGFRGILDGTYRVGTITDVTATVVRVTADGTVYELSRHKLARQDGFVRTWRVKG